MIDSVAPGLVLTARSEGFITGAPDLEETCRRLTAYAEAGADCLYAPGIRGEAQISAVIRAVAPKPVNVLIVDPTVTVAGLAALGVRRISVGGALARTAWGEFLRTAEDILTAGRFARFSQAPTTAEIVGRLKG
jgi:2-methylisocitrate lyase-like PEP mutase family enzyme